mmetsp:Transcript_20568/g.50075  ORF Transcript_20568/g.50075 Transcript_20568/m.50075 type:complete len:401 (-) Transcript_20568:1520-2722(-)
MAIIRHDRGHHSKQTVAQQQYRAPPVDVRTESEEQEPVSCSKAGLVEVEGADVANPGEIHENSNHVDEESKDAQRQVGGGPPLPIACLWVEARYLGVLAHRIPTVGMLKALEYDAHVADKGNVKDVDHHSDGVDGFVERHDVGPEPGFPVQHRLEVLARVDMPPGSLVLFGKGLFPLNHKLVTRRSALAYEGNAEDLHGLGPLLELTEWFPPHDGDGCAFLHLHLLGKVELREALWRLSVELETQPFPTPLRFDGLEAQEWCRRSFLHQTITLQQRQHHSVRSLSDEEVEEEDEGEEEWHAQPQYVVGQGVVTKDTTRPQKLHVQHEDGRPVEHLADAAREADVKGANDTQTLHEVDDHAHSEGDVECDGHAASDRGVHEEVEKEPKEEEEDENEPKDDR